MPPTSTIRKVKKMEKRVMGLRNVDRLSEFGKKLRPLRAKHNIRMEELAETIGFNSGRMYRAELKGRSLQPVPADIIAKLVEFFGVPSDYFNSEIPDVDIKTPEPPKLQQKIRLDGDAEYVVMTQYGREIGRFSTLLEAHMNAQTAHGELIVQVRKA